MIVGQHRFPRQDAVVYGREAAEAVIDLARRYGAKRLMVMTTRSLGGPEGPAVKLAEDLGILNAGLFDQIASHSPRADVIAGAAAAREANADMLVAFGGGSVIDATKLMQLCLWGGFTRTDQLGPYRLGKGEGRKDPASIPSGIRMIAVPTTLSAAEFTPIAGVTDGEKKVKEAFTHPDMAPKAVVLDPAVTVDTPAKLWFSTGIKAVDHAVEQLCNLERAPMGDLVAAEGLRLLARGLRACKRDPSNLEARAQCQHGMWMAISGSASGRGMGASHAIGHTLGGSYGVPHGVTSCITLHAVLEWNKAYGADRQLLVSRLMGKRRLPASVAVRDLVVYLGLPWRLSEVLIGRSHFEAIAEHTMHDRSIRTNPRPITKASDIVEILELAA
ncbi:MAG TPA: iron-containing alcohol dehydrogenase [Hyphomonadaceae bacterium]|nr:iron-containing alcohol dehydrogenase [Hyphomonadaceae bacterium]